MKIKTKLLLAISAIPVLIILIALITLFQLNNLQNMNQKQLEFFDTIMLAQSIQKDMKDEAVSLRDVVIFQNPQLIEEERERLEVLNTSVEMKLQRLERQLDESELYDRFIELRMVREEFSSYKEEVLDLLSTGQQEEATQLINNNSKRIHENFFHSITKIVEELEVSVKDSITDSSDQFEDQLYTSNIFAIIGILLIAGFIVKNVWDISNRLNKVSKIMSDVASGKGDLRTELEVTSADEIGDVAKSFNKMTFTLAEQLDKEQTLTWTKTNIAQITTNLSEKQDLESLSKTLLSDLAPLLEIVHGVLYVQDTQNNEEGSSYRLLGTYALKERKHINNVVRKGEGLIGQAVLEKEPIIITDLPSDYVRVQSGVGAGKPLNLYVLPILFEGEVKAVLEVATFKSFTVDQQNFVEELLDGIGIIIDNIQGRLRLAYLLEEAQTLTEEVQAQSEELQSQQEELRQTNEELEEQTQSLRASEEKLQLQQEELEQTNADLQEKALYLEEQNKKFEQKNREVEEARAQLEEKASQLAKTSKYKSEFLANMSHELRTPLNSLLILSKLLSDNTDGNLSGKQKEYAKTIHTAGRDLLMLINDILDLSKIEAGKMEVNYLQKNVKEMLETIEQQFLPVATEKKLKFSINIGETVPSTINTDEKKLQQILKNLLSNAFKFTEEGSVTLQIDYDENKELFYFHVKDTGIGINSEKQGIIFEAFHQGDGTTSRKYGGTGLGLSISRELASILGGEISVSSMENVGSTFTLTIGNPNDLPKWSDVKQGYEEVAVTNEVIHPHKNTKQVDSVKVDSVKTEMDEEIKRVLIIDDDPMQRNSLMELIGEHNIIMKAVASGKEAMEQIKKNHYDILILDLGLPDTSGFKLLESLANESGNEHQKIFIYTGRDLTSKEEIQLQRYADSIIVKDGYSPERLKEELTLFLQTEQTEEEPIIQETVHTQLDDIHVLIVDDDVRNVFALSNALELYGMKVSFAENGREGIEILKASHNIDIVLMDIMMPEMDGYEAIQLIRTDLRLDTPIIALTAKAMKEDRDKCIEVGASDYIVKPVLPDQLISLMKVWLYRENS
ncbi:response regulator [Sutcliffiella cohnii]